MATTTSRHFRLSAAFAISTVFVVMAMAFSAASASAAACAVPSGSYPTINSALADGGCDPINVAAGTYDESLVIGRSVAIHGAGAGTTKIAPTSKPGTIVLINGGANVELDGFTIRYPTGSYIPGYPAAEIIGLQIAGGSTANVHNNVITEIHNDVVNANQSGRCVIVGSGGGVTSGTGRGTGTANFHDNVVSYCQKQGITVYSGSSATVNNNEVAYGNMGEGKDPLDPNIYANNGIVFNSGSSGSITNNDVHDWTCTPGAGSGPPCGTDPLTLTQSVGILPFGNLGSITVSGNNVHGNDLGFADYLNTTSTSIVSNNQFVNNLHANAQIYGSTSTWTGNTVSGAPYGLIASSSSGTESVLSMTGNVFQNNTNYAIFVDSTPGLGSITAHDNQFLSNANGSDLTNTDVGDLTCNWWGSTTGPNAPGNPSGSGDKLTTGAVYSPWAYSPTTYECGPATPVGALSFGTSPILVGDTTTLTLTLSNSDSDPISNAGGGFTIPAGISATAVSGNTCGGSAATGGGQSPTFSGVQIPASGSCAISFTITAGATGPYSVTLPVGAVQSPRGDSTAASTAILNVNGVPPVVVLTSPTAGNTTASSTNVAYTVDGNASIPGGTTCTINGDSSTSATSNSFSLAIGDNAISVVCTNAWGPSTPATVTVTRGVAPDAEIVSPASGTAASGSTINVVYTVNGQATIPPGTICTVNGVISSSTTDNLVTLPASGANTIEVACFNGFGAGTTSSVTVIAEDITPIDPIPACIGKELLITDVAQVGSRVRVKGFARIKYAGQKVALRFMITGGHVIGYATVQNDGSWSASLQRPPRRYINSNNARYQGAIGGGKTAWIKLHRRMGSTDVAYGNGNFYVTGSTLKPLDPRARVNVTISSACQPYQRIGTLPVNRRSGRFSGIFPTGLRNTVVLARLNVRVRHNSRGRSTFSTYSILEPVVIKTP